MDAVQSIYQEAVAAQLAGRMEDAKVAYRRLLEEVPDHPEGHHNLGLLAYQEGEVDQALEHLMNAVEARPGEAEFWHSLIGVLVALSAFGHAHNALEQAGAAGIAAEELERMRQCIAAAEVPPPLDTAQPVQLSIDGEHEEILVAVQRILARSRSQKLSGKKAELRGRIPERKLIDRMTRLFNAGDLQELEKLAAKLTRSHPLHPGGWHFLGMALMRQGERLESLRALVKANELFPGDAQMLDHLGTALTAFNHVAEAASLFELSLEIRPEKVDTLVRYANLAITSRDFLLAEQLARRAVAAAPASAMACRILAVVCLHTRRSEEALPYLEKAIKADPKMGDAYQDLGYAYFSLGRLDDAIRTSELAVERNPGSGNAFSNLLFFMTHDHRLSPEAVFQKHAAFGQRFEAPLAGTLREHENDRDPERRLRIGFVSADLHNHAVAHFIAPVLEHIDRERFDLFAFHNSVKFDETSKRLKSMFKYWVSVAHVSDKDLAEIIRACRIDILVDLSGHTAGNRLVSFARRPAPLQVSWIGYPNTTGLTAMDYHFADRFNCPPGRFDHLFTEKVVQLPSNGTFEHPRQSPEVNDLPALRNGYLTFGSFNRLGKVSDITFDLWAKVMHACADSRILIGSVPSDDAAAAVREAFASRGISAGRLRFEARKPSHEYLALHHDVDIVLDTIPYPGGTTSNLAVWMGVPVLTMEGHSRIAHGGAGAMRRIGLDEFVACDEADFIARARHFDQQRELLAGIRRGMRERIRTCPYRNTDFVTRGLERAFRSIWRDWCAGRPATSRVIPEQDG